MTRQVKVFGTLKKRENLYKKDGTPYVKAIVQTEQGDEVPVVWWDAETAGDQEAEVCVYGEEHEYKNILEIKASTTYDRGDSMARLVGFYRNCLEAEIAGALKLKVKNKDHIRFVPNSKANPALDQAVKLPNNKEFRPWIQQISQRTDQELIAGWPLVTGKDPEAPSANCTTPLLITEIQLRELNSWHSKHLDTGIDVNPFALELLGVGSNEIKDHLKAISSSPAVEEAINTRARAEAILREIGLGKLLDQVGLNSPVRDSTSGAMYQNLVSISDYPSGLSAFKMLIADLDELAGRPDLIRNTPAGILLGHSIAQDAPVPDPHPAILPSSLRQDEAVHAAMENRFTVVTGPPGTGKSQVIVNVLAAAIAKGQTVLLASNNNKAVDVVVDRVREVSERAILVRTGKTEVRNEVPAYIHTLLQEKPLPSDLNASWERWQEAARKVRPIHQSLGEQRRIQKEVNSLELKWKEKMKRLPSQIDLSVDVGALEEAVCETTTALDAFGNWLGLFRRWRRHQHRLESARSAMEHLRSLLPLDRRQVESCLDSVTERPTRSFAPRQEFRTIENMVSDIQAAQIDQRQIRKTKLQLENLPHKYELEDKLQELVPEHTEASMSLLDAHWEEIRENKTSRHAVSEYCNQLDKRVRELPDKRGALQVAKLVKSALPMLPLWAVTNLSVRYNLPLEEGLFDLVVIDEASQCNIPSALPLLVRGKRALIIGDACQLSHIVNLQGNREARIAERWGLTEEKLAEFSFKDRSLFNLAASRVKAEPIFLDMHFRSPPAIIDFANKHFYENRMVYCKIDRPPEGTRTINWINVEGICERGSGGQSWINRKEAEAVAGHVAKILTACHEGDKTLGIVSPFRPQTKLIENLLRDNHQINLQDQPLLLVGTSHAFQGDESDIIVFSPVVSSEMDDFPIRFAADSNLVNVAITRAKCQLVIIGNQEACLARSNTLRDLAEYVIRIQNSVFDSPLGLELFSSLLDLGIQAQAGIVVGQHRLDLAIKRREVKLNVEIDGHPFHQNPDLDEARDQELQEAGWKVLRFSGREVQRDSGKCANAVAKILV